ncbi:Histone-lysine N-methyltransferase 2C [Portunus trituberculatus]|uniref:Histone-lysine N-methyltransferase 2C n=1 Tax=Portunus trituberculatus TaxID=210409 RepID=A0A5B7EKV2_PORTR|nr:Histone-lysine N-methyltransferase 2C [Portunus trituberculatus]
MSTVGSNDEEIVEDDENNEAIDAIFAEGGDITDIFMHDIISGSMKDDDPNLTGDEDISQDTIDIPSGSGSGTKLTDILGPGFNLDDVADIMKNLPEDGAEDSQDSTLSTTIPQASSLGAVEGEGSVCADSERSISSTPTESPATQTSSNLSVSKESLTTATPSVPITLPAASTLCPNQPPVAPLGSLPLSGSTCGTVPPVQTVSGVSSVPPPSAPVSLSSAIQGPSSVPSIKSPATLPSPIGLASPVTHPSTSALPSTHPSPATGVPSASQTLSSPLPRPDSQTSSHGFCSTPTTFSSTSKPPTPTIPEPQKLWSSNDSQSQSLSLEEDESLGEKATKAPVLYVNVHKPNLKTDFPDTEQKKMLIQRARENKKEYYKNKQFRTGRVIIPQGSSARDPPGSSSPPPLSPLSVESSSTPQPPLSPPSGTQGLNSPLVSSCSLQLVSSENRTSCASDDTSESYNVVSSATTMKVAGVQTSPPGSFNPSGLNPARPSLSRLPDPPRTELPLANPSSPPDPDQHIRVLTPLEIMRTLPVLHQDAFPSPTTTTTTSVTTTTTITTTTELLIQKLGFGAILSLL